MPNYLDFYFAFFLICTTFAVTMQKLLELYRQWSGEEPQSVTQLTAGGSNRSYYRIVSSQGESVIGCVGTSRDENHAFVYLTHHFTKRQLPVPRILAVSDDELRYIQTDLGSVSLFDAIRGGREAGGRYTLKEQELLKCTIRELPNIQIRGARELDFSHCYPQPAFNTDSVLFDLNYFKYCFLKATELDFHELKLEADFRLLAKDLTAADDTQCFLYRDFQARNVMLSGGTPYFIDYQGGRRGPYYYDLASFLWQASAKYPHKLRRELVYEYYNALKQYTEVPSPHRFVERLSLFVLFRQLQVLGAYGFRGYFEKKPHFLQSIPFAIDNLRQLLIEGSEDYPYLVDVLRRMTQMKQFKDVGVRKPLVVRVYSFSYKKGIPNDASGNGGGFVFDCRAVNNPGKYERYNSFTGMDEPVIQFLEDDGEILALLEHAYSMVDASVKRYIDRGFQNLMVSFGCTGGQHRSVYAAQKMAEHINKQFGVEVQLVHREQNIEDILPAK